MLDLRGIPFKGMFASCVKRLEMFHIPHPQRLILDQAIRLGGILSQRLLGPTPANLIPANVPRMPVPNNWPVAQGDRLPVGVRPLPGAFQNQNWRVGP